MKFTPLALVAAFALILCNQTIAEDLVAIEKVKAGTMTLHVPKTWKPVKVASKFRAAQFEVTAKKEKGTADFIVYHFGGPTGGMKANVGRWIGQFEVKGRKVELVRGKCREGDYILAEISGTWNKPDGPPFAQKKIRTPGSRVVGVIVITGEGDKRDYYFIKFSGPDAVVAHNALAARMTIGIDQKTEKKFDLKNAEN